MRFGTPCVGEQERDGMIVALPFRGCLGQRHLDRIYRIDRIIHRRWTQMNTDVERFHDGQCTRPFEPRREASSSPRFKWTYAQCCALPVFATGKYGRPSWVSSYQPGSPSFVGVSAPGWRRAVVWQRCVPVSWKATAATQSAFICVHLR